MPQRDDVQFTSGDDRISAWLYRAVRMYPEGHFAVYVDATFERVVADQLAHNASKLCKFAKRETFGRDRAYPPGK